MGISTFRFKPIVAVLFGILGALEVFGGEFIMGRILVNGNARQRLDCSAESRGAESGFNRVERKRTAG